MSAVLDRTAERGAAKAGRGRTLLQAPSLPQVNLLPPEVRSARAVSRVKQWMVVAAGLALVVVGVAYLLGMQAHNRAQADLAGARATTTTLLAEQAQYAEVPLTTAALNDATMARVLGLSPEVLWAGYLGAIESVVGPTMSIDTAVVAPVDPTGELAPLDPPAVATLTFVGRSVSLPDTPGWIEVLDQIPGFSGARIDVATLTGDQMQSYYEITTTVRVTQGALSNRFLEGSDD